MMKQFFMINSQGHSKAYNNAICSFNNRCLNQTSGEADSRKWRQYFKTY